MSMLHLAAALDHGRYAPRVVFTRAGPILDFARELAVPARVVPLRSVFFRSAHVPLRARTVVPFLVHFWPTVRGAQALVRAERPELVHLNTSVLIPVAIGVRRERVPVVWHVREVVNNGSPVGRLESNWIARLADCVVANSQVVADGFRGRPCPVVRVHNAIDLNRFGDRAAGRQGALRNELGIAPDAPVVGIIGSVQAVKGHFVFAEAARLVLAAVPQAVFLVVGGGVAEGYAGSWRGRLKRRLGLPLDARERLRQRVAELGLAERFRFAGFRQDVGPVIAAMDVLAFPTLAAEGFGRPLIEAMAMGRPVVASDIGPSREILGDEAGLLVPPGDAGTLAGALTSLLTDAERRARMGRAGRRRVEAQFTLEQHVRAIESIYDELLERGARRGAGRSG